MLRHGLTQANEDGVYIGTTDLPLSAKGESELCSRMEQYDYPTVHKVYSSPLKRCTGTAEILFPYTEIETVDDLRELDLGEFENKSVDELIKREDYKAWLHGGKDVTPAAARILRRAAGYPEPPLRLRALRR